MIPIYPPPPTLVVMDIMFSLGCTLKQQAVVLRINKFLEISPSMGFQARAVKGMILLVT